MSRITSNFNRGADGWTIQGDATLFEWRATGGNGGGHLFWDDAAAGNVAYWTAPAKFLGDLGDYTGGKLSFDWYSSGGGYLDADVLITGANGQTLVADVPEPGSDWSREALRLGPAGQWHVGSLDGPLATTRQIAAVLDDVVQFQIRAEHVTGGETGGLDNVKLVSKPTQIVTSDVFGADRFTDAQHASPVHHAPDAMDVVLV